MDWSKSPENRDIDIIARAFWRRIEPYKYDFKKELPREMPVEVRAAMGTALSAIDFNKIYRDNLAAREALEKIAAGEGYYGAQAKEYKDIAKYALKIMGMP